jgi:hypothetical protein
MNRNLEIFLRFKKQKRILAFFSKTHWLCNMVLKINPKCNSRRFAFGPKVTYLPIKKC